jgi:anti-anti-sigma regulatory factor
MGRTAFATLFDLVKTASAARVRVAVCGMKPNVRVGAQILSLDQYTPFTDDEAAGLAALKAGD